MCQRMDPPTKLEVSKVGPRLTVDVLIGLDFADLHYSLRDIRFASGQPIARLTPLGWTCIGVVEKGMHTNVSTNFACTYLSTGIEDIENVNVLLQRFCELESSGIKEGRVFGPEDKCALGMAEESITYTQGHYQVAIPWKGNAECLPDNYEMAKKSLYNLERRLVKCRKTAEEYFWLTFRKGTSLRYSHQLIVMQRRSGKLPHFLVIR